MLPEGKSSLGGAGSDRPASPRSEESSIKAGSSGTPTSPKSEADSTEAAAAAAISPHYDASRDVVIRMEFLGEKQMKAIVLSIWGAVLVGLGLLAMGLDFKLAKDQEHFMRDNTPSKVNLGFAVVLTSGLLVTWVLYMRRIYRANRTGKRWSLRRKKGVQLVATELTLQLINVIFFLVPNAYSISDDCAWFGTTVLWSGFVRWTCWNSIFLIFWVQAHNTHPAKGRWARYVDRPDAALMDAPWVVHWPKLGMWVGFEAVLLALTVHLQKNQAPGVVPPGLPEGAVVDCTQLEYNCTFSGPALGLVITVQACIVIYAAVYLLLIRRSFQVLNDLPYKQFRIANFMVRLQVRLRTLAFLFFVLSSVIYFFVGINTCSSFISSWLGFLSMQFVMSCIACANAFIYMPKRPDDTGILQVWLQEFAWTEADEPRKRAERASSLPEDSYQSFCMDCEPIFVFETAIKMMYWSYLCYDAEELSGSPFSLDTALSLYDLEHFELFWERSLDTKAIVGWSEDMVVIAFRGTASVANVKADIQAWRTPYPAGVGSPLLCTAPQVHMGFHKAWTANGLNERLIGRLSHILYRCTRDHRKVKLYVTGHSLGGALATLCAFDINQRCPDALQSVHTRVYTFGAPRTGNHAFAKLYNQTVPDTWHIINNDDLVTRGGKFFKLYKRPGHRVLINRRGDLVVRPSFVEASIRQVPGGGSIRDHLLTSYQKAMVAVVAAQFGKKSFQDGKTGVLSLAEQQGTREALQVAGVAVEKLKVWAEQGVVTAVVKKPFERKGSGVRQLLGMMRRPSSQQSEAASLGVSERGASGTQQEKQAQQAQQAQLQSVVVFADADEVTEGASSPQPQSTVAEGRMKLEGGILHKQSRRSCQARKCRTVCQLRRALAGAKARPSAAAAAAASAAASPMSDPVAPPPGQDAQQAGQVQEAAVLELQPSLPDSPRGPLTSTRGDVADQPQVALVMSEPDTPRSSHARPAVDLIPEGDENLEEEGGGEGGSPTAAPQQAIMPGRGGQAGGQRTLT